MSAILYSIQRDSDGAVVDVSIKGDLFRMERLDPDTWWVCIYRGSARTAFTLRSSSTIQAEVTEDEIAGKHRPTAHGETYPK